MIYVANVMNQHDNPCSTSRLVREFSKGIEACTYRSVAEVELAARNILYQEEEQGRAILLLEGFQMKAGIREQLFAQAYTQNAKVEQFSRLAIQREEGETAQVLPQTPFLFLSLFLSNN